MDLTLGNSEVLELVGVDLSWDEVIVFELVAVGYGEDVAGVVVGPACGQRFGVCTHGRKATPQVGTG